MHNEIQELEGGTVELDMGVQIISLNSEESFEKWTDQDSLYGSRHDIATQVISEDTIYLFLLLNFLGSISPRIPSYFPTMHWAYRHLSKLETRSDEHLPFITKGVSVLHVIPSLFPDGWHTVQDDGEHVDMPTVRDWSKILAAFTLE
ncbi:hypothetical protein BDU57DRAFT_553264 [Ampelomyces quisqualis]|uniref:Peptide hydrolase n=1 Tax=Ampelomyces quisqualis TaxID=50730 RepID=A0A6A5R236_AMPQU|nr:hypothetical protein BDU57DRAFT_553264 [Ampelomyces quisqualis]